MTAYTCVINEIAKSDIQTTLYLNPERYLDCEDEEELKEEVLQTLQDEKRGINMSLDSELSEDFELPEDFVEAWKEAKEYDDREKEIEINLDCKVSGYMDHFVNLRPGDFLNCDDEDELREQVARFLDEEIIDRGDFENIDIDWSYFDLPEEFIEHWHKLKDKNLLK